MYSRFLTGVCERSLCRAFTRDVRIRINRLSHVAVRKEEQTEITSAKFPEYKVIYTFPYVRLASTVNKVKRHFTILSFLTLPTVHLLHDNGFLATNTAVVIIVIGVLFTSFLHSLGILCNNLVGHIYFHPKHEIVILSYVDPWGKRMDYKTNIANIIPMSDNQYSITDHLFDKVTFSSQKLSLKILVRQGQIFDYPAFRCILGTI